MPFGTGGDVGVRCKGCGKIIDGQGFLATARPSLPDPLPITCPFCGYKASYPKSALQYNAALNSIGGGRFLLIAAAVVAAALVVAGVLNRMSLP